MHFASLVALAAPAALAFQVQPPVGRAARTFSATTTLPATLVDTAESAARDIGAFDEWTNMCGVQKVESVTYTTEDNLDFSLMTTEPLEEGASIVMIPQNMILSSAAVKEELGASAQAAVDQLGRLGANEHSPEFYLFLKILVEYEKGDESPYFPWLNSMPRLFYNAASMTNFCYECLPPLVFQLARAERVKFDNFFDCLQKVDIVSPMTKVNNDLAKWAFNIVYTRSFGPDGGDKKIVPLADMLNHGTDTEVDLNYDEEGNCIVYTTKPVEAGSPLRMSYGCPTNPSRLFATYGFLDETSPATFCKIMTIKPNKELLDIGFDFSRMLFYRETGEISQEVWDVMLYENLADNRQDQEAFYTAHMNGDADTKGAIHGHYFLETSTALKKHVDTFLTQLDELSAKGVGMDLVEHPRLPLILKHNEFVKSTFLNVKQNLDPMVAQAAGEPVEAF